MPLTSYLATCGFFRALFSLKLGPVIYFVCIFGIANVVWTACSWPSILDPSASDLVCLSLAMKLGLLLDYFVVSTQQFLCNCLGTNQ